MAEWIRLAEAIAENVRDGGRDETEPPSARELEVLRNLKARTAAKHGATGEAA